MLKKAVEKLARGVEVDEYLVYAKRVTRGRFKEEVNLDLYLKREREESFLLYAKIFYGRKPYYKPWVEIFGINDKPVIGEYVIKYFESKYEDSILSFFSKHIEAGGRIFIEYLKDYETWKQLEVGVPPPATRLGFKLFKLGYTWFKDWYFPEGFMEGGQKLQAENP